MQMQAEHAAAIEHLQSQLSEERRQVQAAKCQLQAATESDAKLSKQLQQSKMAHKDLQRGQSLTWMCLIKIKVFVARSGICELM